MVLVHFTADLSAWRDPKVMISWFVNPDLGGSIGTGLLYPIGPWDDLGHSREWNFRLGRSAVDAAGEVAGLSASECDRR